MPKDSHRKRSQSEAPRSSKPLHSTGRPSRSSRDAPSASYGHPSHRPSRLSQVTNAADISDVDAQAEVLSSLRFSPEPPSAPLSFDTISAWIKQGGRLESLNDRTLEMLLSQYIGPKGERPQRQRFQASKEVPPPAPMLEEEDEEDGGVPLSQPPSSSCRHRDKGKGRAR